MIRRAARGFLTSLTSACQLPANSDPASGRDQQRPRCVKLSEILSDQPDEMSAAYSCILLCSNESGRVGNMTEPPALMTAPDEQVSGLWLWHGAPPAKSKERKTHARRPPWLGIAGVLLVGALAPIAGFMLSSPRHPEPAKPAASSPVSPLSGSQSSAAAPAVQRRDPTAEETQSRASAPAVQHHDPTAEETQSRASATAEETQSRASAPAAPPVSSKVSRPVSVGRSVVQRDHHQRKRTKAPLAQLFGSPAFRNGTLRPIPEH